MEKLKKIFEIVIPNISAIAVVVVFLYLVIILTTWAKVEIPNRDLLLLIMGVLVSVFKDLFSYWFGSSSGSKAKTEMMSKAEEPKQ
jgi:uncharacterized membrane protein